MHVTILGKRWRFRFSKLPRGTDGECDPPDTPGKEIRINQGLNESDTLETVVHEAMHAVTWHHTEEWVTEVARDIARILWRLGYRRTNVDDEADGTKRN